MGIRVSDPAVEALESESRGLGPSSRAQFRRVASQAGGQRWRAESQGSRTRRWRYFTDPLLRPCPRSAEALTPLHVAAAWGCRRGLELLLSQGADPALRDRVGGPIAVCSKANPEGGKEEGEEEREGRGRPLLTAPLQDGFLPLDLAEQQGHQNCARLLRELETRTRTPTRTWKGSRKPEPEPELGGEWYLGGWEWLASDITLQISASNAQGFTTRGSGLSLPLPRSFLFVIAPACFSLI